MDRHEKNATKRRRRVQKKALKMERRQKFLEKLHQDDEDYPPKNPSPPGDDIKLEEPPVTESSSRCVLQ